MDKKERTDSKEFDDLGASDGFVFFSCRGGSECPIKFFNEIHHHFSLGEAFGNKAQV